MLLALDSSWVTGFWILGNMTNSSFYLMVDRFAIDRATGAKLCPKWKGTVSWKVKHWEFRETSLQGGAAGCWIILDSWWGSWWT